MAERGVSDRAAPWTDRPAGVLRSAQTWTELVFQKKRVEAPKRMIDLIKSRLKGHATPCACLFGRVHA